MPFRGKGLKTLPPTSASDMQTLQANCRIFRSGKWIKPGDFFEADPSDVGVLGLIEEGKATPLEEAIPTSTAPAQGAKTKTPWIHDPEDLKDYDLDTLNATIHDSDSSVEPYETLEEAIAHLSMDFAEWQRLSSN